MYLLKQTILYEKWNPILRFIDTNEHAFRLKIILK